MLRCGRLEGGVTRIPLWDYWIMGFVSALRAGTAFVLRALTCPESGVGNGAFRSLRTKFTSDKIARALKILSGAVNP